MFKVNEYFNGKVKSLAFTDNKQDATIGVMAPGEYEFATSCREYMTVISGELTVLLPGAKEWQKFGPGHTFIVEPDQKFQLKANADTSYICRYEKVGCSCQNCQCN
ncbi:MAG: pyrimidine/purine nucleoside phosphorylase [Candidatus Cloacimonetes bacterium]|nr:pyrimidine/purine nucleoside phosphorylase [Candidatus Cloacimonadota bacterium]